MTDDVRERLARMSRNFAAMNEQFQVMGRATTEVGRQLTRQLSRVAGQQAARRDWSDTLWPKHEETRDDDDPDLRS